MLVTTRAINVSHTFGVAATALAIAALLGAAAAGPDDPVLIRGGAFVMGTKADRIAELKERYGVGWPGVFENETPARRVTLGDFRLDRFEVTNARFAAFLAANPQWRREAVSGEAHNGHYLEDWDGDRPPAGREQHPVAFVTWHAAQAFCRWAGGHLPTEAQWECAARAGDDREFPWGDQPPAPELANYHASGHGAPVAVGSYPANPLGLHDLTGNVWEFLYDAWEPTYSESDATDPVAGGWLDNAAESRVTGRRAVRGASFGGAVVNLRTRWRDSHLVGNATGFVGFRCAYPAAAAGSAR